MVAFAGFVGSFYGSQSRKAAYERLVNYYVENISAENESARVQRALYPAPGFRVFSEPPAGEGRGIFSQNDRTFAVVGDQLVEIMADGSYVLRPLTTLADFPNPPGVVQSDPTPALTQPNPPRVQQGGAVGATSYGYKITGTNTIGESVASLEGTIATGYATLDANNFNHLTWDTIASVTGWKIYRTTGPGSGTLIGTITDATIRQFQDHGQAGVVAAAPSVDTSAGSLGVTTRGYRVAATIGIGTTAATAETTAAGYATLNEVNHMRISWPLVLNAQGYRIWRTTGPGVTSPVLIGEVDSGTLSFFDTGQTGEESTPPVGNTTTTQSLVNDGSMVSISSSGDAGQQLFIVATGKGYVLDLRSNVFAQVLDGATFGDYLDGYFIALDAGTSTFRWSGILNGFSWDDTDYQQRTAGADKWIAMAVNNREVWLVGTQSTEVWVHTGAPEPAAPWAPLQSVFIEKGIGAAFTLVKVETALFWLQQDRQGGGVVVRTNGYAPVRVSDHAIENAIRSYATIADAEAWTYQDLGHTFYVLSFPTEGRTWVYDLATQEWHERGYWPVHARDFTVYRPRAHAFCFSGLTAGYHLVVDREDGTIYEMGSNLGMDVDGRPIVRVRRAPHISNRQKHVVHDELELILETGEDVPISGAGSDPTLMLKWSDNGGFTWSNEHWRQGGATGQYSFIVRWQRLGSTRDTRVYELRIVDPVPRRILGAELQLRAGSH